MCMTWPLLLWKVSFHSFLKTVTPCCTNTLGLFSTEEMSEEDSSAATAAYVNNAVAMRKARTASRRASLTVGSPSAGAGVER